MSYKICLFAVIMLLAITMIMAEPKKCAAAGQFCVSGDNCCSGICMTFRARCAAETGIYAPPGYIAPKYYQPLLQSPNQINCSGLGSPCHTTPCCEPYYCGSYGLQCKSL